MRSRVRGKPGWATTRPPTRRTLAAPGSSGSTGHDALPGEGGHVDPLRVRQQPLVVEGGDRALEVQAAGHRHRLHPVAQGLGDGGEAGDAGLVRPGRAADEERPAHAQDVAALERRGQGGALEGAESGERRLDGRDLGPPRGRPRHRQERHLVEDDGHVLDEAAVRQGGVGRQLDDLEAERAQEVAVGRVLGDRESRGRSDSRSWNVSSQSARVGGTPRISAMPAVPPAGVTSSSPGPPAASAASSARRPSSSRAPRPPARAGGRARRSPTSGRSPPRCRGRRRGPR